MNERQLYGRAGREAKSNKIRAKLNNERKLEDELDAETRDYLEGDYDNDLTNSNYRTSDYGLKIKLRQTFLF